MLNKLTFDNSIVEETFITTLKTIINGIHPGFYVVFLIMAILAWGTYYLEHKQFRKTFAFLPRYLWPTKQYWRDNKQKFMKY
ncbi:hypothetical protein P364_0131870 [Paenibacillus sp. MAEPY2]|nr:hypothetical protein P364_0131870 [Paenibacillus sp. MAEPY2]KGP78705.1 hypothetical protein P363_0132050 [Paenibacillus sp. MAEPY1]OZQ61323.1 hypothetical protein CA599_28465 [Paenibacillus taichungensis]